VTSGPLLDIVIVSYRCRDLLRACLHSLYDQGPEAATTIHVVDNASRDGTGQMVRSEFPEVDLLECDRNTGFAVANNLGIRRGRGRYVLALNPDTLVPASSIDRLLELMEGRPDVGACGCRLVLEDGSFDHAAKRSFPTIAGALGHFLGVGRATGAPKRLSQYRAPDVHGGPVDAVNGAFMLMRREALENVGLFDEGYWMYMEDLDLCYRLREAGWTTWYEPSVEILHVKGGTSGRIRAPRLNYAFHYGMFRFYRKHYAASRPSLTNSAVYTGIAAKLVVSLARSELRRLAGRGAPQAAGLERRFRALAVEHATLARVRPVWRAFKRLRAGGSPLPPVRNGDVLDVPATPLHGVNLIGYLRAELGIGEIARKIAAGLERADLDYSTVAWGRTLNRQRHPFVESTTNRAPYDTNVICVNADQLPIFREEMGSAVFEGRYTIGVWFWEAAEFPRGLHSAFDLVDEIWVASDFVRRAIAAETSKPVDVLPIPLEVPAPLEYSRRQLGMPEGFLFLFSFDFLSVFERKNPLGVIDAFTRAFADGQGPSLVIKSINGEHDPASLERLHRAASLRTDIHVVDRYFSADDNNGLMASCDCYVSLHRSEGFGLTMAEAMAYGKPVVATGYSGNLQFMTPENSHLVPYRLVAIPRSCGPYPSGGSWAEPDGDAAATLLRRVYEDQTAARELGRRAGDDLVGRFSLANTAAFLAERVGLRAPADAGVP
jgi:GT2 family glycosyltransferase